MNIRKAEIRDAAVIQSLLTQLGYPTANGFIGRRLAELADHPDHFDLVYELDGTVAGFISFHFIPQITLDGNYLLISYLVVDDQVRGKGVGRALEAYCTVLAREKKCKRILLHSNIRRIDAHRFYIRQGYKEYKKAFVKELI